MTIEKTCTIPAKKVPLARSLNQYKYLVNKAITSATKKPLMDQRERQSTKLKKVSFNGILKASR